HLGGLALAVPETVRALDAVGMGTILLETVGVGQIEVAVADATDTTVVVVNPGWGDAVQANKAGLLEIADIFVINKADRPGVPEARRELDQMLDLSRLGSWRPPIVATTATTAEGVTELWEQLGRHREHLVAEGALDRRRAERLVEELRQVVVNRMTERGDRLCSSEEFEEVRRAVISHRMDPYDAAEKVMERLAD
ncbi:MAG: methylmalonyl Co-A mutase-associated GTPase MeaB, partial [Acidimicrobiales bacterium]